MPELNNSSSEVIPGKRRARRHRRWAFLTLFFIAAAGMATLALLNPQTVIPAVSNSDRALIAYERAQRLFRAQAGLVQPGEPDLSRLPQRLAENGVTSGAPVMLRIFKREFELELWMQRDGVFHRFAIYPICRWSGRLGPKIKEGDLQAPEGFYTVDASALNPNSSWYRSFNLGYPNAFDRSQGRTGSLIMVHGGCASVGCFAMTNRQIDEIWRLVTAALGAGQRRFQVQVYPFRMSETRLAENAASPHIDFWRNLKTGYDLFDKTLLPPRVSACQSTYRFEPGLPQSVGDQPIDDRCPLSPAKSS